MIRRLRSHKSPNNTENLVFLDDIAEKTEHPFGIRKTRRIHSNRSSGNILSKRIYKKQIINIIIIKEDSAFLF